MVVFFAVTVFEGRAFATKKDDCLAACHVEANKAKKKCELVRIKKNKDKCLEDAKEVFGKCVDKNKCYEQSDQGTCKNFNCLGICKSGAIVLTHGNNYHCSEKFGSGLKSRQGSPCANNGCEGTLYCQDHLSVNAGGVNECGVWSTTPPSLPPSEPIQEDSKTIPAL